MDLEQVLAELRETFTGSISDLRERLDAIETRQNRIPNPLARGGEGATDRESAERRKAFFQYVRTGAVEAQNALVTGDDTGAGFLAPAEYDRELERDLVEFSPIRQAARISRTSTGELQLPRRSTPPTASWTGETETRPETEPEYALDSIPTHELACFIEISAKNLEDSAFDLETEFRTDLAEAFGAAEGKSFLTGASPKQPEGILLHDAITKVPSLDATSIAADSLRDIYFSLPPRYRSRAVWMMNDSTAAVVSKLKDDNNNYLWTPGLREGESDLLLSRPVLSAVDMPDTGSGGVFPVLFGDLGRGYRIVDRLELSILRDPYSQAHRGMVRFHARRRVGGAVRLAEAIRILKTSVS